MEQNREVGVKITSDENKQENNSSKYKLDNSFPTPSPSFYVIVV